jgi:hypothetical protein
MGSFVGNPGYVSSSEDSLHIESIYQMWTKRGLTHDAAHRDNRQGVEVPLQRGAYRATRCDKRFSPNGQGAGAPEKGTVVQPKTRLDRTATPSKLLPPLWSVDRPSVKEHQAMQHEIEAQQASQETENTPMTTMAAVMYAATRHAADRICALLQEHGITARVTEDEPSRRNRGVGVPVLVPDEVLDSAAEILAGVDTDADADEFADDTLQAGREDDDEFEFGDADDGDEDEDDDLDDEDDAWDDEDDDLDEDDEEFDEEEEEEED